MCKKRTELGQLEIVPCTGKCLGKGIEHCPNSNISTKKIQKNILEGTFEDILKALDSNIDADNNEGLKKLIK